MMSWYGILAAFALGGMSTALTIATAKGKNIFGTALKYKILSTPLTFLISLGVAGYYYHNQNLELTINFLLIALAIPLLESSALYSSYLQGKQNFKHSSYFLIISKVASLVFFIFFAFGLLFTTSYMLTLSSLLCVSFVQVLYAVYLHKKFNVVTESHISEEQPDNQFFRSTVHFTFMGIFLAIGSQADKIILFTLFGSAVTAGYWIATIIPMEIARFLGQVYSIYVPKLSQASEINKVFKRKILSLCALLSFFLFLVCVVYVYTSPFIFNLVFPKYTDVIYLSQMFAFVLVFSPFMFLWTIFMTTYDYKLTYLYYILDPALQISLYIILVYVFQFGVIGVVYGLLVKTFIMSMLGTFFFIRYDLKQRSQP